MSIFGTGTQVGAEGPATGSLTVLSGSRPARKKKAIWLAGGAPPASSFSHVQTLTGLLWL